MATTLTAILIAVIILDTAHSVSPVVMAWGHREFRRVMLSRKGKFIVLPCVVMGGSISIGWATSAGWTGYDLSQPHQAFRITGINNPFPVLDWAYYLWNFYHFGAQNFGVMRLARQWWNKPGPRWLDRFVCITATVAGAILLPFWVGLILISFTHWLTELALTAYVSAQRYWFLAIVLLLGGIGFLWTVPPWQHDPSHGNLIYVVPSLLSHRIGIGFVHFLYDRWVWKFSDPQVRATIGRELFRVAA